MNHSEKAVELFMKGANCSQSVFAAFSDVTGMEEKAALRLSSSFGGGISRLRETCGACLGMCLAAGAVFGYDNIESHEAKKEHYAKIQGLVKEFADKNGSYTCRVILGETENENTLVPEERTAEYYGKRRCCIECIRSAAEILDKYIDENT
ncbi:MAG: C_GCAxxG_C_C family protein [Clostridia bacterium]|nr:C_GCAxxG_C_C family protein [Clostridia bacterium]